MRNLQAQQDAQFSLFNFNQLYFNPAMAGADGVTRFQLLNRLQWQGYQTSAGDAGAPNTLMFSAAAPLNFIKSAVGVHYVNDRLGAMGSQEFQLSYAYRLNINDNTLALGVRAGMMSRFIDFSKLNPREQGDPLIPTGRIAQSRPDIAVGAYYDTPSYYVGVSVNHLNRAAYDFTSSSAENALAPNAYVTAGYRWEPLYGLEVQPMILLKSPSAFSAQTLSLEGGVMATWNETFFGGFTYRMGDAYNVLFGIDWRSFRLGGAIDLTGVGRTAKEPASYEILLSYSLPAPSLNKKKIVRTPRFRY
jgi:type IX secretion system PorP/SprF family membrane protein